MMNLLRMKEIQWGWLEFLEFWLFIFSSSMYLKSSSTVKECPLSIWILVPILWNSLIWRQNRFTFLIWTHWPKSSSRIIIDWLPNFSWQPHCWQRLIKLPHVSSNTAIFTLPISVGSDLKLTPKLVSLSNSTLRSSTKSIVDGIPSL